MSIMICHACEKHFDSDWETGIAIAETSEALCDNCTSDYFGALEEKTGEFRDDLDELPTFDREMFEDFRERQDRERWADCARPFHALRHPGKGES